MEVERMHLLGSLTKANLELKFFSKSLEVEVKQSAAMTTEILSLGVVMAIFIALKMELFESV